MNTETKYEIQKSIGVGSMGTVYAPVDSSEIENTFKLAATNNNLPIDVVREKMQRGCTIWLNRAENTKLRGFNAEKQASDEMARDAARDDRLKSDGYFSNN